MEVVTYNGQAATGQSGVYAVPVMPTSFTQENISIYIDNLRAAGIISSDVAANMKIGISNMWAGPRGGPSPLTYGPSPYSDWSYISAGASGNSSGSEGSGTAAYALADATQLERVVVSGTRTNIAALLEASRRVGVALAAVAASPITQVVIRVCTAGPVACLAAGAVGAAAAIYSNSKNGAATTDMADTKGTPDGPDDDDNRKDPLTGSQRNAIKKVDNVINNNAKPHDFEGVRNELAGRLTGYDHVTEMRNSVRALEDATRSLDGSLRNPYLSSEARSEILSAYTRGRDTLNMMRAALGGN